MSVTIPMPYAGLRRTRFLRYAYRMPEAATATAPPTTAPAMTRGVVVDFEDVVESDRAVDRGVAAD